MNLRRIFLVVAVAVVIGACASTATKPRDVKRAPARMTLNGYSFEPPDDQGWRVLACRPAALVLGKHGVNPYESYYVQASISELRGVTTGRDLAQLVRDAQVRQAEPARFLVTAHNVSAYPRWKTPCAQSHWVAEDHGAVKPPSRVSHMVLEAWSLTCIHPENARVGVNLELSKRYYPGRHDPDLSNKASDIFKSLRFTNLWVSRALVAKKD